MRKVQAAGMGVVGIRNRWWVIGCRQLKQAKQIQSWSTGSARWKCKLCHVSGHSVHWLYLDRIQTPPCWYVWRALTRYRLLLICGRSGHVSNDLSKYGSGLYAVCRPRASHLIRRAWIKYQKSSVAKMRIRSFSRQCAHSWLSTGLKTISQFKILLLTSLLIL